MNNTNVLHRVRAWWAVAACATLIAGGLQPRAATAAPGGGQFNLIKDLGATQYNGSSLENGGALSFRGAVAAGPVLYFMAYTPDAGTELWRSDGTDAGTFLLKDICPGAGDQFPAPKFVPIGSTMYFAADDCASGRELWKSDGTVAGTVRVKDGLPGPLGSRPDDIISAGNKLFFTAYDGNGTVIWRSDGTDAGTVSTGIFGTPFAALSGAILYTAFESNTCVIKRLDATTFAVASVASICPQGTGSSAPSIASGPALAYFSAGVNATGVEVWRSDGTPAGTFLLKDIRPGATTSNPTDFFVDSQGRLFFSASDGANGSELWKSDGTSAGTVLVKDINSGPGSSDPSRFAEWHSIVFFQAYDGTQYELWRTDGTAFNTVLVKDLTPAPNTSSDPTFLTLANNGLYFVANDATHTSALFKTNGTPAGTVLVKDIRTTALAGGVSFLIALGSSLFFRGDDGVSGGEPWVSDGTDAGTHILKDIVGLTTLDSTPSQLTAFGDQLLYFGYNPDPATPSESYAIYHSDGTVTGTLPLKTLASGPYYLSNNGLDQEPAKFGNTLYFQATASGNTNNGRELWRSDGTVTGTAQFLDIEPGSGSSNPTWLTPSGSTLFFAANTSAIGVELWKTGGTPETTALVKDIQPGNLGSFPQYLVSDGADGVYFAAHDAVAGTELWRSDGSTANTIRVVDIRPGTSGSSPENLTLAGGTLFFTADNGVNGRELWVTTGTPESTHLVRDLTTGPTGTNFEPYQRPFVAIGNRILFVASSALFGSELWVSDGTDAGTAIVKDIFPGGQPSNIDSMTALSGTLYFAATGDDSRRTLWRSDGTTAGTHRVLSDTTAPVNPESLAVVDGLLYFSAADQTAAAGRELWRSDGTAGGMRMVQDLNPGPISSNPRSVVKAGAVIYLTAFKPGAGVELWAKPPDGPAAITPRAFMPTVSR